jgi:large exoprotein involved in heme utilization and adhesion
MNIHPNKFSTLAVILSIYSLRGGVVQAQSITPQSIDGTNTVVTSQGSQLNLSGGITSGNNLFHGFEQFNLKGGEIADFKVSPQIQNIFSRVVGGNASSIDGLIRVSGGDS